VLLGIMNGMLSALLKCLISPERLKRQCELMRTRIYRSAGTLVNRLREYRERTFDLHINRGERFTEIAM